MYKHSSEVLHVLYLKLRVSYVAEVSSRLSFADKARWMFIFQSGGWWDGCNPSGKFRVAVKTQEREHQSINI